MASTDTKTLSTGSQTWTFLSTTTFLNNILSYSVNTYVYMNAVGGTAQSGDTIYGYITAINTTTISVTFNGLIVPQNTGSSRSSWNMTPSGLQGPYGPTGLDGAGYSYTTSTSSITYSLGQHRFTITDSVTAVGDGFGYGDRIKLIETTKNLNDYRFMSGYLIAKTGTDWTINVDTIQPTTATNLSATSWRVGLTGDITTQTSQNVTFLSTQSSLSTSTGALIVSGGVGIGGSAFVGIWTVPQSMTSATAKSYTGTPTGATIFLTGTGYNKPAYWDGTKWYLGSGSALY